MIEGTYKQDEQISKRSRSWWPLLAVLLLVLGLGFAVAPSVASWLEGMPTLSREALSIASVNHGELVNDVAVSGRIVAASAPSLYSSESGVVDLLSRPGDAVKKGDILAKIDSPELAAQIAQQRAQLSTLKIETQRGNLADKETQLDLQRQVDAAQVTLNAARREKKRAEISYKQQLISQLDWVTAKDKLLEAELLYKHAVRKVSLAKDRLAFEAQNREHAVAQQQLVIDELHRREQALAITAPVDGVVGNWLVGQKDRVASSVPLMTIVDLSRYEAELRVPEFYADQLGLGLNVALQISGRELVGDVASVSPEIQNNQVLVRVRMANTESLSMRQNQRLNARIEFDRKDHVLSIRRGAFLSSGGKHHVFRVGDDGIAEKVPVSLGISSVDAVEILSGLNAGDQIIVSSYEDFLDKHAVKISAK